MKSCNPSSVAAGERLCSLTSSARGTVTCRNDDRCETPTARRARFSADADTEMACRGVEDGSTNANRADFRCSHGRMKVRRRELAAYRNSSC